MLDVPRFHQLNGCTFFLDRDGSLTIDVRDERRSMIALTADEVYGLLTFLRLPGVATLIERQEAHRQEPLWRESPKDPAEEVGKVASGFDEGKPR